MITDRQNELMCRVGRDSPMGQALRHFWMPALLSSELPAPDCDPVKVELLGESLVAFRDSEGNVGLLDEKCCHRGVSLTLGRSENCGLRCLYHGWLFRADGTLLETPNIPDPNFKSRFKARAYPVRDAGGYIWAYLGDPAKMPAFPDFPWMDSSSNMRLNTCTIVGCNFVQVIEGLLDGSHLSVLHSSALKAYEDMPIAYAQHTQHMQFDAAPRIEVEETEFGLHYAAIRRVGDKDETRVTTFISPFWVLHPHADLTIAIVPMSDTKSAFFNIWWDGNNRFGEEPLRTQQLQIIGIEEQIQNQLGLTRGSSNGDKAPSRMNRYHQDRDLMRAGHFTGIPSLMMEDVAVTASAGLLRSRADEHLSTADLAIAQLYRLLIKSAQSVADGGEPKGFGVPMAHITSRRETLDADGEMHWRELVPSNALRTKGAAH